MIKASADCLEEHLGDLVPPDWPLLSLIAKDVLASGLKARPSQSEKASDYKDMIEQYLLASAQFVKAADAVKCGVDGENA